MGTLVGNSMVWDEMHHLLLANRVYIDLYEVKVVYLCTEDEVSQGTLISHLVTHVEGP